MHMSGITAGEQTEEGEGKPPTQTAPPRAGQRVVDVQQATATTGTTPDARLRGRRGHRELALPP